MLVGDDNVARWLDFEVNFLLVRRKIQSKGFRVVKLLVVTLPKTNHGPENQWLEDEISFGDDLFSGAMLVSGSVIFLMPLQFLGQRGKFCLVPAWLICTDNLKVVSRRVIYRSQQRRNRPMLLAEPTNRG